MFVFDAELVSTRPPIRMSREFDVPRDSLYLLLESALAASQLACVPRRIEVGDGASIAITQVIERNEGGGCVPYDDTPQQEPRWTLRVVGPEELTRRVRQALGGPRCVDLASAVQLMGSDDPVKRDWGDAAIEDIAETDWEQVWRLRRHPDPEVAARAYRALSRLHLLPDAEIRARAQRILEELSTAMGHVREALVDELLALGKPATLLLLEELNNFELQPVVSPVVAGDGKAAVPLCGYGRNCGSVGLWVAERPNVLTIISSVATIRDSSALVPDRVGIGEKTGFRFRNAWPATAELMELREWLISASRIPPGATGALWQHQGQPADRTGSYFCWVGSYGRSGYPIEEFHDDLLLKVPLSRFESVPCGRFVVLREHRNPDFNAELVREQSRVGLRVTNVAGDKGIPQVATANRTWFAAIGEDGAVLAGGALGREPAKWKVWNIGETQVTWLEAEIPGATAELWLGYDAGPGDDQVVPAPLRLKNCLPPGTSWSD